MTKSRYLINVVSDNKQLRHLYSYATYADASSAYRDWKRFIPDYLANHYFFDLYGVELIKETPLVNNDGDIIDYSTTCIRSVYFTHDAGNNVVRCTREGYLK